MSHENNNYNEEQLEEAQRFKDSIIRSILVREVIRIDILKITNMANVISGIRPILDDYGFKFVSSDMGDIDLSIEDPDELETSDFIKNLSTLENRKYRKDDEYFVINECILFFQKLDFSNYKGIEEYLEMITKIISKIIQIEKQNNNLLYIDRISIRKVNKIVGRDLEVISNVFNYKDINKEEVGLYHMYENFTKKTLRGSSGNINVIKTVDKGVGKVNNEEVEMYSAMLDIDAYCREMGRNVNEDTIETKLEQLAVMVFRQFMLHNNKTLNKILTDKNKNILKKLNICDGVNTIEK